MSLPQLRNMVLCAEAGAMVMPAMPAFYQMPKTLDDLADFMAARSSARSASRTISIHDGAVDAHPTRDDARGPGVDKTPTRIAGMFDAIAPRYDLLNHVLSAGLDTRWRTRAISELRLGAGARVIDLCTGTADLAVAALRAAGSVGGGRRLRRRDAALASQGEGRWELLGAPGQRRRHQDPAGRRDLRCRDRSDSASAT